jgi:hypothetical protein
MKVAGHTKASERLFMNVILYDAILIEPQEEDLMISV